MSRKVASKAIVDAPGNSDRGVGDFLNRHRTMARLALAVLVPAFFLMTAEGILRLAGYGYATSLYLPVEQVEAYGANTRFLLGEAALAVGDTLGAAEAFDLALEYDALRFRTDHRLNNIIRETASSLQSTGVRLADTEQMLRRSEPSGTHLPGRKTSTNTSI